MLYTAQYSCGVPSHQRYDITETTKNIFAPDWEMVESFKKDGDKEAYTAKYLEKMRESYKNHTRLWHLMLDMCSRNDIILVCYCKSGEFCHRLLLVDILQKIAKKFNRNLEYGGEYAS